MKHLFLVILLGLFVQSAFSQGQVGSDIDGEAAGDRSGESVSMSADGGRVAIGAPFNDGNGSESGHVRVYEDSNGTWIQVGSDIDGEARNNFSGNSVAISVDGSRVAIGAYENSNINGLSAGHVRVYEDINGTWTQVGSDIDGEAYRDLSGWSVSMSADGSRVVIGAPLAKDSNGIETGHARVYEDVNGTWTRVGIDIDGEAIGDFFGNSVSMSADGSRVAIGAVFAKDSNGIQAGHVRVYEDINGTWKQVGSYIDGDATQNAIYASISGDGSRIAIGPTSAIDSNGIKLNPVRVYDDINGTWTQVGNDIDGEGVVRSVSISADGSRVAAGTADNQVSLYDYINGTWSKVRCDYNGEAAGDNATYASISGDGSRVAIGAIFAKDPNGVGTGHVRVYNVIPTPTSNSFDTISPVVCDSFITPSGKVLKQSGQYFDILYNSLGCDSIISINLLVQDHQPEICLITADSLTGTYNRIIWEKPLDKRAIDSFIIAREFSLNTFQEIGRVHRDSLSIFDDYSANPNATAYSYKISLIDSCGRIRPYSGYHKTIHLQYFGGGTFQWSQYEIEGASNPVANYNFYRDDNGTGNFQLLVALPGGNTSYTDLDYTLYPNAAYRTEVVYANGLVCNPSQLMQQTAESFSSTSYSKAYSNILSFGITSVEEQELEVYIYPNPTSGFVSVDLPAPKGELRVYDSLGKLIILDLITGQKMHVDLRSFSNGVYYIRIDQDGKTVNRSVMLHR